METIKKAWKENRKRFAIILCIILLCMGVIAAGIIYYVMSQRSRMDNGRPGGMGTMQSDGSIVASGTTMVGMVEDSYDIDYLDDDLYIEEVYISSGDEIQAGDPI
ncbi:MAG: hypothetical protein PHS74_12170, partial [Lachnospiraceae bacterium]|nr:hypothetical protein [Lachnospiraceae bacterium]